MRMTSETGSERGACVDEIQGCTFWLRKKGNGGPDTSFENYSCVYQWHQQVIET